MKTLKMSKMDLVFNVFNILIMLLICFIVLYPIWYVIVYSLNDGIDAMQGSIYWWPRKFTLENYKAVFTNSGIINAFYITILKTVIGTVLHVLFTGMVAYAFSRSELIGRKFYIMMGTITLFFGGGLIPYFLLIRNLGLFNNFLVYIIPAMFNFYEVIIFISFFRGIPNSLEEAAKIDGANYFTIFFKIILPVSLPVVATIALFHGVYQWNDYFTGVIFINNPNLQPIQTYLYRIIAESGANQMLSLMPGSIATRTVTSQSLKMATMVVTTLPIVFMYPFLQKYFVKGVMIGSLKG